MVRLGGYGEVGWMDVLFCICSLAYMYIISI